MRQSIVHNSAWDGLSDNEVLLRRFDMDVKYGPSIGITRSARYARAVRLGHTPPSYISELIQHGDTLTDSKKHTISYLGDEACWSNISQRILVEGKYESSIKT